VAIAVALALLALALIPGACGGDNNDDDEGTATTPAPTQRPDSGATPPSPGALPPELLECFADKGYDVESPAEIHSAPPQVVQECFAALHQGGSP
jgi:hypothetical protein